MNTRIRWIHENPGAPRDEAGYWRSLEGRFTIGPQYRSTVYPDSYTVEDRQTVAKVGTGRAFQGANYETVRECKEWAQRRVDAEIATLLR